MTKQGLASAVVAMEKDIEKRKDSVKILKAELLNEENMIEYSEMILKRLRILKKKKGVLIMNQSS